MTEKILVTILVVFFQLMDTIFTMVEKTLLIVVQCCMFFIRSVFVVIDTCIELLCAAIFFHVYVFWRLVLWNVALLSLPARALVALHRERKQEMHLCRMQDQLDSLIRDMKDLQERLQIAIKERAMLEMMLEELEEDNDQAIDKIVLLETTLQDLKQENYRLKEVQGTELRHLGDRVDTSCVKKPCDSWVVPWKSCYDGSGLTFPDLTDKDARKNGSSNDLYKQEVLRQQTRVALLQSLFSAIFSLLVGIIIWESEELYIPLLLALLTIVGISLKSAVQFFVTIKNKPASDAVALLSINWFILGTLTYPTLPRVAGVLSPFATRLLDWTLWRFGFF